MYINNLYCTDNVLYAHIQYLVFYYAEYSSQRPGIGSGPLHLERD